ncbi:MAG TPA: ABC transporter permease [Thermoanaerobaculia bacterium]|nr:ABC transporter permease [Thermoanaerobaculia bacterium]
MENLLQDIRYGIRILIKQPVFTTVAVLSLALGIGANTAIFSLVDALLWRSLPVEHPETLVSLYTKDEKNPGFVPLSHLNWKDYRDMSRSFSGVLGYTFAPVSVQTGGEPALAFGVLASGNYFDLLGIHAALGRTFLPEEDGQPGAHPVVVVSHRFWKESLAGDPRAVGKPLTINGSGYTVIGVAPESFTGTDIGAAPQLWVPMAMNRQIQPNEAFNWFEKRRGLMMNAIARLRPGVTPEEAQAEIATIGQRLQRDYPEDNKGRTAQLVPLAEAALNPGNRNAARAGTSLLMAVVGLVLLIACANVSNLLLAQAAARRREIAVRLSQGAARGRLIRQLLTESLLLSLLGGAVGLLIANWVQALLPKLVPQGGLFPLDLGLSLDLRVLAFTLGVSLLTGLVFGLVPALQASKADLVSALKNKDQAETGKIRGFGIRGALVAGQVALSLVSLIAAGLFVRSLGEMRRIDPGFPADHLAVASFDVGLQGWDQSRGEQLYRDVRERIAALPGVTAAALAQAGPFQGSFLRSVFLEGEQSAENGVLMQVNTVTPELFDTMGVRIVRGRAFTEADRQGAPGVVIVNETMAERFWPGQDPIGKRFHFFGDDPVEVVGIAKTIKYNALGEQPQPYVYEPLAQRYVTNITLVVRSQRSPENVLPAIRREMREMAPTMPLVNVAAVPELLNDSLGLMRTGASLLALFGILALALASVGLYGVMSFSVTQRSREIGVRMALGAQQRDVLRLVLRQGLTVVGVGLLAGLLLAFGATRLVAGMLFGVTATDPMAFGVTSAVLALVALGATLIPALRAISVSPLLAIRYE